MTSLQNAEEGRAAADARFLRSIPRGDLTPEQAAPDFRSYVLRGKSLGLLGEKCLELAWRAAVERRSDEELRRWHHLFRDTLSLMEHRHPAAYHHLARLEDAARLLALSIQSEALPEIDAVVKRATHSPILELLQRHPVRYLSRSFIEAHLNLQEGCVSAYLHNLTFSGLVERDRRSVTAQYRITRDGLEALKKHQATLS